MKNAIKFVLLFALLGFAVPSFAQQNTLTQTYLTSAVNGGILGAGVTNPLNPPPQNVIVNSATGITGITPNLNGTATQPTGTVIYVDREEMYVLNVSGTNLTVTRGYDGTVAAPHAANAMVLAGNPQWFYQMDPGGRPGETGVGGASCTSTTVYVTPWVNTRTGAQWICSSVTSTWVPGWNNPLSAYSAVATATVPSAAGAITPSGPFFSVSGTSAITGFNIPVGFPGTAVGGGCFTANPTGIWTWTAAGNIAKAGTVTAALETVTFCWNAATSKWIPSRIS
jgi:hypothetical protein